MKRILVLAACAAACVTGIASAAIEPDPRARDAVGNLRVLVIRATWGPAPMGEGDLSGATALYSRASFGLLKLQLDITPWLHAYASPVCPTDSSDRSAFGSVGELAQDAAARAGYDISDYGRIAYVLPDRTCNAGGMGARREVFITTDGGVLDDFTSCTSSATRLVSRMRQATHALAGATASPSTATRSARWAAAMSISAPSKS